VLYSSLEVSEVMATINGVTVVCSECEYSKGNIWWWGDGDHSYVICPSCRWGQGHGKRGGRYTRAVVDDVGKGKQMTVYLSAECQNRLRLVKSVTGMAIGKAIAEAVLAIWDEDGCRVG